MKNATQGFSLIGLTKLYLARRALGNRAPRTPPKGQWGGEIQKTGFRLGKFTGSNSPE
jgi:hypothetical protein